MKTDSQNSSLICVLISICLLVGCSDSKQAIKKPAAPTTSAESENAKVEETVAEPEPVVHLVDSHYVDDRQCADCHEEIWKSYQAVGMARSAYEFDANSTIEDFDKAHFYHELSKKHYEMKVDDGKFVMTRYRLGKDQQRINEYSQVADFIIGSGNHSRTYCYRDDSGAMFQMPVVWYSQTSSWGMAPGYDQANHDGFSRQISRECMFCHNAYPEFEPGKETFLASAIFPKKLPHGIGCQRCHGPGEAHVKAAEKDPQSTEVFSTIVNSSKLPAQQRDDVCNQCHLQPTSSKTSFLRHFDREAYSFRPGEKLSDFQSYAELADAKDTDLFEVNHHSYRMSQSKCFTESDGALNCISCHDPHKVVPKQQRASFYRKNCFQCHGNDDCMDVERGRKPEANCIECHMPTRRTEDVISVTMTDHKIVRSTGERDLLASMKEVSRSPQHPVKKFHWREGDSSEKDDVNMSVMRLIDQDINSVGLLQSQISKGETTADESKAVLAQALLENGRNDEALKLLNSISPQVKANSSVQSNLGLGLIQQGKFKLAIRFLEKAVNLKPVAPEAHFNLGIAYINTDRVDDAIEQFTLATKLQPNLTKARFYLSAALARNEQYEKAEQETKRLLQIDPDYPSAALMLAGAQRYLDKRTEAIAMLEDERVFRPKDVSIVEELSYLTIEAVAAAQAEPRKSLDAAKDLYNLTRKATNSRTILAAALVQNGYHSKALEALGSLKELETPPEKLLIAAVAQANLNQKETSAELYKRGQKALENVPEPRSRLLEITAAMAEEKLK